MRKKIWKRLCCIDGIIAAGCLCLAVYENGTDHTGTAALASLGRWSVYAVVCVCSTVLLAIFICLMVWETKRGQKEKKGK